MITHHEWLAQRPFTLALGAGFFGFFAHTGLLLALEQAGLRPARITGVSAGALAGGLWASGLPASELAEELRRLRREDFWDPGLPLGGWLRGQKFMDKLHELLAPSGVEAIEDCSVAFATVVHDLVTRSPRVLQTGALAPAIAASCCVPLMFRPRVHVGKLLVDGGVSDRNGEQALHPEERVMMHALVSRSPWSRWFPDEMPADEVTTNRVNLVIPELPRVTPFRLEQGPVALSHAFEAVSRWLLQPRGMPAAA
ncbi:MAG: patatin-like phospholipase family protein [Nannocystaceae bacterium]